MFGHKGKGFILQLESEVSVSHHLLHLPGTEAYVYPVELKCSKPPSCCGRWVLHDKQASLAGSTGLCWRMKKSEPNETASWKGRLCMLWGKCMHVYLCTCVNVFTQVCLCVLTKLFNLSQSLSFAWFWQLFVFRLKVTSLWGFSTWVCMLCVCWVKLWVKLQNVCMLHICWQLCVSFHRETSAQDGKYTWTYIT